MAESCVRTQVDWSFVVVNMSWVHHVGAYKGSWEIFCKNAGVLIYVEWHCAARRIKRRASRTFHAHQNQGKHSIHAPGNQTSYMLVLVAVRARKEEVSIVFFVTCCACYKTLLFPRILPPSSNLKKAHTETYIGMSHQLLKCI